MGLLSVTMVGLLPNHTSFDHVKVIRFQKKSLISIFQILFLF